MRMCIGAVLLAILSGIPTPASYAQTLEQEGPGTFVDVRSLTAVVGDPFIFNTSFRVHHRLTDRLDVGLRLQYSTGRSAYRTVGPVVGYSRDLGHSFGLRSTVSAYAFSSTLPRYRPRDPELRAAGYGGRMEALIHRKIDVGSVDVYPSVGVFLNANNTVWTSRASALRGPRLNGGLTFQMPVSFKLGGDWRLDLVPRYSFDVYRSRGAKAIRPGLGVRIGF